MRRKPDPLLPLLARTVEVLRRVLYLAADPQSNPAVTDQGNLFEDVEALQAEIEKLRAKTSRAEIELLDR